MTLFKSRLLFAEKSDILHGFNRFSAHSYLLDSKVNSMVLSDYFDDLQDFGSSFHHFFESEEINQSGFTTSQS